MFISEKQLVDTLKANYSNICAWNTNRFKTKILEEVNLGFGVADLVISKLSSEIRPTNSCLTYFDATIYNIIECEKRITFEKIIEITKASITSINCSLSKLITDNYIKKNDSIITLYKPYQSVTKDSIAIEAKLKNWKRALDQAFRYKWFARRSFVILDNAHISPALAKIDNFKKYNVGLAEINSNGYIILHFTPKKAHPINRAMGIMLNEQLRKSLST